MTRSTIILAALLLLVTAVSRVETRPAQPSRQAEPSRRSAEREGGPQATVNRYCVTCHSARLKTAGLVLEGLSVAQAGQQPQTWEKVVRKVRTGMMPPANAPRPERATLDGLAAAVESTIDRAAAAAPNPGAPSLHRLNRTEYANAIRDLLALPVDAATLLPADDASEGFDNMASVLGVSPALMQAYVSAAATISRLAVGDPTISADLTTYQPPRGISQAQHREGLPLGTRGGLLVTHVFPLDAEYEFRVGRGGAGLFGLPPVGADDEVEITIDGQRVQLVGRTPPRGGVKLTVPAGPHAVGVAVVNSLGINGPLNATGPGDTPSRRRIFICAPPSRTALRRDESADAASARESRRSSPDVGASEVGCARRILSSLATQAMRRPVGEKDPTVDMLLGFYESGRTLRGFEAGIQYALARILVDPRFIYRFETEPAGLRAGSVYRVGDVELASRLSFFLWSTIPDAELLGLAAKGRLSEPAVLAQQARRMLADPRADALVDNLSGQWLQLRQLDDAAPVTKEFDGNLRYAFTRETELLFETIVREDRSLTDLIDADYTFVDERLARHYGIPNVRGSRFRRVTLADPARRGLLGQGSFLTVTSAGNRTSPVKRGKWILENLLGAPVPSPPPGVETNLEKSVAHGAAPTSVRQRLEQHRANPSCAACHAVMDPIGFALEPFDLIGRLRDTDDGVPVNASGRLVDGTPLDGPASLRQVLLDRRDAFVATAAEKLLTYALGRRVEYSDMPAVRAIAREAARNGNRFSSLVTGIVQSTPFQMKRMEGGTEP
jgi:mono/diheme cytochrome c family protein